MELLARIVLYRQLEHDVVRSIGLCRFRAMVRSQTFRRDPLGRVRWQESPLFGRIAHLIVWAAIGLAGRTRFPLDLRHGTFRRHKVSEPGNDIQSTHNDEPFIEKLAVGPPSNYPTLIYVCK